MSYLGFHLGIPSKSSFGDSYRNLFWEFLQEFIPEILQEIASGQFFRNFCKWNSFTGLHQRSGDLSKKYFCDEFYHAPGDLSTIAFCEFFHIEGAAIWASIEEFLMENSHKDLVKKS